jgi:hypothetical protein
MTSIPYLYQTPAWQHFWLKTHDHNHECIEVNAIKGNLSLKANVYLYQWRFGQRLMHLPAGPYLQNLADENNKTSDNSVTSPTYTTEDLTSLFIDLLTKILGIGKNYHAVALRINLDPVVSQQLKIESSADLQAFIIQHKAQQNVGLPVLTKSRLMFPAVAMIDLAGLTTKTYEDPQLKQMSEFMKTNEAFWLATSETTRKQTRRSTKSNFRFNTENNPENVETAYNILKNTSSRQGFTLPPLDYYLTMAQEEFFHILLIEDQEGIARSSWIGIQHGKTLTNQYGGNDEVALKNFLPNLSHLYGIYLATTLSCQQYDLGGYEKGSRQARFKDGYRPQIIDFIGGVDLVYLPWYYRLIELGGKSKKLLKK